ncbi:MAG: hypothetical protein DMF58_07570 [Acidobacteria bacterium]|nr:MAG: hypothetical protein DMF58_07570 [Acidobacteriota bacterium]
MIAAIVDEAHRGGRKVAAHAQNPRAILAAAHAGVHSIDHGSLIHHTAAAELRARGIVLMPTLARLDFAVANAQPATVEALERRRDIAFTNAKMAFTRGVRIVLGTNASVLPNRRNARELCALVEIGMTPAQAVHAATIDAGELLGWKVGRIQPGYLIRNSSV